MDTKWTRTQLEQRIEELEAENEDLNARLDSIADIVDIEDEEEDGLDEDDEEYDEQQ